MGFPHMIVMITLQIAELRSQSPPFGLVLLSRCLRLFSANTHIKTM